MICKGLAQSLLLAPTCILPRMTGEEHEGYFFFGFARTPAIDRTLA
jgi:hypothetical protein